MWKPPSPVPTTGRSTRGTWARDRPRHHAWLWLVSDPGRLGQAATEAIDQADELAGLRMTLVALDPTIAALAATLPMHGDPADRLIVASAMSRHAPLVTRDQAIQSAGLVPTVW